MNESQITQQPQHAKAEKEAPKPSLEEREDQLPETVATLGASDVQFVLATFSQCMAAHFARHGGDTRYTAQSALVAARQALGAAIAVGIIPDETRLPNGQPLWLSPAVPPMGPSARPAQTL